MAKKPQTIVDETPEQRLYREREKDRSINFFGFEIRRKKEHEELLNRDTKIASPVIPQDDEDGIYVSNAAGSGYVGQVLDVRGDTAKNEREMIVKYRNAALQTECDSAIEDIVNEAIVMNDEEESVSINLDLIEDDELDEKTKEAIVEEFDYVLQLLNFRNIGSDIFRQWYIDGKIVYHKIPDLKNPREGLKELRRINPTKVQKIREIEEELDPSGAIIKRLKDEYFIYSEEGFNSSSMQQIKGGDSSSLTGVKMPVDSIAYVTSGLLDASRRSSLSYLQKALRTVNQLRMMEDSLVIYRLARAPERRVFYIGTGTMSAAKSTAYVERIMRSFKDKIKYDAKTGEIAQDSRHMSILEDFWLPRREGDKSTEIQSLSGGDNLGQIDDIVYFQKKLYKSLNVPVNRLDNETGFNIGRTTEISRDELKFQKFIDKLRMKFSHLFKDILKTQLLLKRIISTEDWEDIKEKILIDYQRDSFFTELKENEIISERMSTFDLIKPYIGIYFSEEYALTKILRFTEEEIKEMRQQILDEAVRKRTEIPLPAPEDDSGGGYDRPVRSDRNPLNIDGSSGPDLSGGPDSPLGGGGGDIPGTGLGGINEPPAPPQPDDALSNAGDDNDQLKAQDPNEPTLNPKAADFPDLGSDNNDNKPSSNERPNRRRSV